MSTRGTGEGAATYTGGTSILGLLGIAFIVLKLTHVINWSWWWVTVPFWGPSAIMLAGGLVFLICYLIASIVKNK